MIRVEDLYFEYPGHRALDGVEFELEPHRITALVGPNGAGKTTLMRCIAALAAPLSGRIRVKGVDTVDEPRRVHALCCYMPDLFGLYDALTVKQCVEYAYASRGGVPDASVRARRVAEVLEQADLKDLRARRAGTLSRGQRQRVALAQALVHDPEVVLLDEPASGLDPEARAELSRLLLMLREQGKTLLVSSHILNELQEYSDRVLILEQGRVMSHQSLGSLMEDARAERRRLRIVLAEAREDLPEVLAGRDGVGKFAWEDETRRSGSFIFSGDLRAQARLLEQLLGAGLPLAALEEQASLQQAYLQQLREESLPPRETS